MATYNSTININAPAQKVFDTLTKPGLTRLWQFGRALTTDWKPGSEIKFSAEWEGKAFEERGTVLEIRANELVKYNLFTARPGLEDRIENYTVTSYLLTEDNGQTRLELIQEDNRPTIFIGVTLKPILESLKKIAETN